MRSADKGGVIVVMNGALYSKLNAEMIQDKTTYKTVHNNPTRIFKDKLRCLLKEGVTEGALTQNTANKLFIQHPVTPIYHSLPKIYKNCFPPH